ncbi:hypothetical protein Ahy_A03g012367 isoform K [Arachis hypogaea]|uniref:Uncharacterized protein n=1 Tax=Arachis hypogaea TaxID=3818 RepID=A0A445DTD2_ARAHY|nr:hypothetical protein Ahy_A03g012367 isoform K [Arachis hypogaea]
MRELLSQDMPMYYLEILNLTGLYLQQIPSSQKLCVIVNRFNLVFFRDHYDYYSRRNLFPSTSGTYFSFQNETLNVDYITTFFSFNFCGERGGRRRMK